MSASEEQKAALVALVKSVTRVLQANELEPRPEPEFANPMTERIIKMLDDRRDAFGCNRPDVIGLVSAIAGEEIRDPADDSHGRINWTEYQFAAVVPTGNSNGHDYPLGQTIVLLKEDYALERDGDIENHLTHRAEEIRIATDEEIDAYFAELPESGWERLHTYARGLVAMAMKLSLVPEAA